MIFNLIDPLLFSHSQISKNSQSKHCHFQTFFKLNSTFAFITWVVILSTMLAVILKFAYLCCYGVSITKEFNWQAGEVQCFDCEKVCACALKFKTLKWQVVYFSFSCEQSKKPLFNVEIFPWTPSSHPIKRLVNQKYFPALYCAVFLPRIYLSTIMQQKKNADSAIYRYLKILKFF